MGTKITPSKRTSPSSRASKLNIYTSQEDIFYKRNDQSGRIWPPRATHRGGGGGGYSPLIDRRSILSGDHHPNFFGSKLFSLVNISFVGSVSIANGQNEWN